MTDRELTRAVRAIWRKACSDTNRLIKAQKFRVFEDWYCFHRFIKYKDAGGEVKAGSDLLRLFLNERKLAGRDFVIATPKNIKKEKRKCRTDAAKECRRQIANAKATILANERLLNEILSDKKNVDYGDR